MYDPVLKRGFLDTKPGLGLTRTDVIDLIRALQMDRKEQEIEKEKAEDLKRAEYCADREKQRLFSERVRLAKAADRVY